MNREQSFATLRAPRQLNRRRWLCIVALGGAAAVTACAAPAASPAAPPPTAPPKPTAAPTAASTAAPKPAAATQAPQPAPTQAPATPQQVTSVKIGVIGGLFDNAFSFIGQDKGLFRKNGVDVEFVNFQDGVTMTKAIVAGEILTGETGIPQIFPAVISGGELKIVAATKPKLNFIIATKKEIRSLEELYGKTIGTNGLGAQLHIVMLAVMEANKLDGEKLNYVNVGPAPQVFQALVAGKVDAGPLTAEWIFPTRAQPDLSLLVERVGDMLPNFLRLALPMRDQDIRSKRSAILSLLKGYGETYRYVPGHRDEVIKIAVDRLGNKQEDAERRYDLYVQQRLFDPNLSFTKEQIQFMQELNIKVKQQDTVLPFERVATFDLLDQMHKEMGIYSWQ